MGEYALKVFIYIGLSINFKTQSAYPGIRKIAEETGMDKDTVTKAVGELEEKGFLEVFRKEKSSNVYTPTRYFSIGESVPSGRTDENLSLDNSNLSLQNENLSLALEGNLHNKNNKKEQKGLSEEETQQAYQKVDKILELNQGQKFYWKGREFFRDNHKSYADWYHEKTNQICGKKFQRSWQKAFSDWQNEELKIEHLQAAYDQDIVWRKVFTDPNELTKKAIALKASSESELRPIVRPEYERYVSPPEEEFIPNPKVKK